MPITEKQRLLYRIQDGTADRDTVALFREMGQHHIENYSADEIAAMREEASSTRKSLKLGELPAAYAAFLEKALVRAERYLEWSYRVVHQEMKQRNYIDHFGMAPKEVVQGSAHERFQQLVAVGEKHVERLCENPTTKLPTYFQQLFLKFIEASESSCGDIISELISCAAVDVKVSRGYHYYLPAGDVTCVVIGSSKHTLFQACLHFLSFTMEDCEAGRCISHVVGISAASKRFEAGTLTFELKQNGRLEDKPKLQVYRPILETVDAPRCWNITNEEHARNLIMSLKETVYIFTQEDIYQDQSVLPLDPEIYINGR